MITLALPVSAPSGLPSIVEILNLRARTKRSAPVTLPQQAP